MTHNEFKDRLFEILNETDTLPIADIDADDKNSQFKIILDDGSIFIINTNEGGTFFIVR